MDIARTQGVDPVVAGRALPLIILGTACYLLDGLNLTVLGPFGPRIADAFQLDHSRLGAIFAANLAGEVLGLIVIPMLQGRREHATIITWCTLAFALFGLGAAFAQTFHQFILLRFLTGIGLGGILPSWLAIVAMISPEHRRGTAVMSLFLGYGCGQIIAGVTARLLPTADGWRAALLLIGVIALACAVASYVLMRRPLPVPPENAARQTAPPAASPWGIFRDGTLPTTLLLWIAFTCALSAIYSLVSWLPTMLIDLGRRNEIATISASAFAIGGVASNIFIAPMIDRFGAFRIVAGAFIAAAILLPVAALSITRLEDAYLLALLAGLGFSLMGGMSGTNVVLTFVYPPQKRAIGAGWAKSVSRLGTIVPALLIGIALTFGVSQRTVVALLAVPAVLAAVAIIGLALRSARQSPARTT